MGSLARCQMGSTFTFFCYCRKDGVPWWGVPLDERVCSEKTTSLRVFSKSSSLGPARFTTSLSLFAPHLKAQHSEEMKWANVPARTLVGGRTFILIWILITLTLRCSPSSESCRDWPTNLFLLHPVHLDVLSDFSHAVSSWPVDLGRNGKCPFQTLPITNLSCVILYAFPSCQWP